MISFGAKGDDAWKLGVGLVTIFFLLIFDFDYFWIYFGDNCWPEVIDGDDAIFNKEDWRMIEFIEFIESYWLWLKQSCINGGSYFLLFC